MVTLVVPVSWLSLTASTGNVADIRPAGIVSVVGIAIATFAGRLLVSGPSAPW